MKRLSVELRDIDDKTKIIEYLFKNRHSQPPNWIENFSFPVTLFDFINFIKNIALEEKDRASKGVPTLYNHIDKSNSFSVILSNRPKPVAGSNSTFHDIKTFLEQLKEWKSIIGDNPTFSVEDYRTDKRFNWSVKLRYSADTMDENDAKKALLTSMKFLKEILSIDVSDYENSLNPTNKDSTTANEELRND